MTQYLKTTLTFLKSIELCGQNRLYDIGVSDNKIEWQTLYFDVFRLRREHLDTCLIGT
jgi:hypothetical protein